VLAGIAIADQRTWAADSPASAPIRNALDGKCGDERAWIHKGFEQFSKGRLVDMCTQVHIGTPCTLDVEPATGSLDATTRRQVGYVSDSSVRPRRPAWSTRRRLRLRRLTNHGLSARGRNCQTVCQSRAEGIGKRAPSIQLNRKNTVGSMTTFSFP